MADWTGGKPKGKQSWMKDAVVRREKDWIKTGNAFNSALHDDGEGEYNKDLKVVDVVNIWYPWYCLREN